MWLSKEQGGSAVGPHEWKNDGDVIEVPDDLGSDLLRLGGYKVAEEPKPEPAARSHHKAAGGGGDGKKDGRGS